MLGFASRALPIPIDLSRFIVFALSYVNLLVLVLACLVSKDMATNKGEMPIVVSTKVCRDVDGEYVNGIVTAIKKHNAENKKGHTHSTVYSS